MKNNHPIPNNHFKKTAIRYKTWFNDRSNKLKRKVIRERNEKKVYPMPSERLYPVVRCPTLRHHKKIRYGRGFTPEECAEAGLDYCKARTLGISVDNRRRNQNEETFNVNVDRLKKYSSSLVIYKNREEAKKSGVTQHKGKIMPIKKVKPVIGRIEVSKIESKLWAADKVKELIEETKYKKVESA